MNTKPEALRLADALEDTDGAQDHDQAAAELRRLHEENQALRHALSQPEKEPVCFLRETAWSYEIAHWDDPKGFPVYTAPPKREWVGLTDEEIEKIVDLNTEDDYGYDIWCNGRAVARDVEAKLKEKNGG